MVPRYLLRSSLAEDHKSPDRAFRFRAICPLSCQPEKSRRQAQPTDIVNNRQRLPDTEGSTTTTTSLSQHWFVSSTTLLDHIPLDLTVCKSPEDPLNFKYVHPFNSSASPLLLLCLRQLVFGVVRCLAYGLYNKNAF